MLPGAVGAAHQGSRLDVPKTKLPGLLAQGRKFVRVDVAFDRHMRDILTVRQHRVVHLKMYRPAGRLLLGLDPEELFF